MSSIRKTRGWLCIAAFATAFWITLRVMAFAASPPSGGQFVGSAPSTGLASAHEIRDPALEQMISRFARAARALAR